MKKGFTLIELLVVCAIIAVLAGLVLSTAGYIQQKGASSRAEAEIAALSAALESYKAEYGDYPETNNGDPAGTTAPSTSNAFLRAALQPSGSNKLNPLNKVFFDFPSGMGTNKANPTDTNQPVLDPFGEPYGYRYPGVATVGPTNFFQLWARSGSTNTNRWLKTW